MAVVGAGIAWAVLKDNSPEMAPTNPTIFFLFIGISCFGLTAPKLRPLFEIANPPVLGFFRGDLAAAKGICQSVRQTCKPF